VRIAIVGGTGKEGRGLAMRWARAGHEIAIGSRDAERARERARELSSLGLGTFQGGDNLWAAGWAEVALISVPYSAHGATLTELRPALQDKVVIDITVPIVPPKVSQVQLPQGQAAALEAQAILGPAAKVVAALHHVSAIHLTDLEHDLDTDALVCGDDEGAKVQAMKLVEQLGLRALDAGMLRNAIALESLTPVLLYMNRKYKSPGAGLRITGLPT
jgi:8-hydroxy-5-deazaflavin:NADPH oxidoreductase